ncbi:MAG: hypothetical protein LDL41_14115, partial [Coleofasciculus sp. S288]|nr:hypothetical protein [Coleofasciculus sp. S288]
MEYWEFLIQKEGKRSWQPIKPPKMELEAGRYRVVAHSSRKNTDVEICVTHTSTEEAPPKRRSQKRSRRTNREGLMVVIPFTHLKPGVWELRCCGDILSDFLGTSWQESVQVNVVPQAINVEPVDEPTSPVIDATCTEVQADVSEILSNTDSDPVVAVPFIEDECEKRIGEEDENGKSNAGIPPFPAHPIPEVSNPPFQENEQLPATVADIAISSELVELDEEPVASTNNLDEGARAANPLLDQSLQALEQILQQVLDPVLQDFERAETPEPETETPESEVSSEIESDRQGLTLSLDEDTFVVRRGESLTIPGRLTLSDVNQVNGNETSSVLNDCFQGSLRYELRDPQTSQLLLDVQHPLPQQALPLTFSHSLEIPAECNTRLILGKVTLYGLTSRALTSQPFTVTADLDELLGAIIPGSKVMPVAKMLVLANNPEAFQDFQEEGSEAADLTLDGALLDLVNIPRNPQPLPLQPISQKPLPPQLYQPTPTQKSSKSLQLPDFPKVQPVAASAASLA